MEKTIKIGNKDVTFKCTASTPLRYKAQFGKSFLADAANLMKFADTKKTKKVKGADGKVTEKDDYDFTKLNLELIYNLAWAMAKTADHNLPDPLTWLDTFDVFPLDIIAPIVSELLEHTLQSDTSAKNV